MTRVGLGAAANGGLSVMPFLLESGAEIWWDNVGLSEGSERWYP